MNLSIQFMIMSLYSSLFSFLPSSLSTIPYKLSDVSILHVISSVVAIVVLKLAISFIQRLRALPGVPGPPVDSYIYGHTLQIRSSPVGKYFKPWMKEYGHVYKTYGALSVCTILYLMSDSG